MPELGAGLAALVAVVLFGVWMWWDGHRRGEGIGDPQVRWFASHSLATGEPLRALPVLVLEVCNPGTAPLQLSLARTKRGRFGLSSRGRSVLSRGSLQQGVDGLAWHPLDCDPAAWSVAPRATGVFLLTPRISGPSGRQQVKVDRGTRAFRRYHLPACEPLVSC